MPEARAGGCAKSHTPGYRCVQTAVLPLAPIGPIMTRTDARHKRGHRFAEKIMLRGSRCAVKMPIITVV